VTTYASPSLSRVDGGWVLWLHVAEHGTTRFVPGPGGWIADPEAVLDARYVDPSVGAGEGGLLLVAAAADGSGIHAFTGRDGRQWDPVGGADEPVLVPERPWEGGWIGSPSAAWDPPGWLIAYEGGPGAGVALASLDATGAAVRLDPSPAITAAEAGTGPWWEVTGDVGSPELFGQRCGPGAYGGVAVLFEARGLEWIGVDPGGAGPPLANLSVGYARVDRSGGVSVDPRNPFFDTMAGIGATRSENTPAIGCVGGRWTLLYTASDPADPAVEGLFEALAF
jgi:hypothetical protein